MVLEAALVNMKESHVPNKRKRRWRKQNHDETIFQCEWDFYGLDIFFEVGDYVIEDLEAS